jgi:5'-deoxynucleotidase YfbR-like HD superfamily hydrolase
MRVEDLLTASYTKRFHTVREDNESQRIGEHSFGVALIIVQLHPDPSVNLIKAALYHDLAEGALGDIPATAKWRFQQYDDAFTQAEHQINAEMGIVVEITHEEKVWLACADMLELLFYCQYRSNLKGADRVWRTIWTRVHKWFERKLDVLPEPVKRELNL